MRKSVFLTTICGILLLVSCKGAPKTVQVANRVVDQHLVVQGTVSYKEGSEPPKPYWVEVELVELKENGTSGKLIAKMMVESPHQMPVPYKLIIHQKNLDMSKQYGLNARVFVDFNTLVWTNATPKPAIVEGNVKSIDIVVDRVKKDRT